ncbi:MAG: aminopeptidase [Methermicoccaceae archaeon]
MELLKGAEVVMWCMGAREGERCLVITDTQTHPKIAEELFGQATQRGCEAGLITMLPREVDGAEPPDFVAAAMAEADVVVAATTRSLTHTSARRAASEAGARVASMPGITLDMMSTGGLTADYGHVEEVSKQLAERLKDCTHVRVLSSNGTDLDVDVRGRRWFADVGICRSRGCMTNLPAGEVYISPKNADGTYVVDGSMAGIGLLDSPLTFRVENRCVVEILGKHSEELGRMLDEVGRKARNVAELGIGTNPVARLTGKVLEDEKVGSTVHFAVGNSISMGGGVDVPIHLDGIIREPTLIADGEQIDLKVFGRI